MTEKRVSLDGLFAELDALRREAEKVQTSIESKQREIEGYLASYGFSRSDGEKRAVRPRTPKGSMSKDVLDYLAARSNATTKEVREACGLDANQAQAVLAGLKKRGLVMCASRGSYEITEEGRKSLGVADVRGVE